MILIILLISACAVILVGTKYEKHNNVSKYSSAHSANCFRPYARGRAYYDNNIEEYGGRFVDEMNGHEFEFFCADILRRNGFSDVSVTRGSGDQGVDVLATKDGIKYAVQCKHYASPLSNKPVQEVNAGKMFYHCDVGVVMTNSTFTPGAKALAEATDTQLWDRQTLLRMINVANTDGPLATGVQPTELHAESSLVNTERQNPVKELRKGMILWAIICIVFAGIYVLVGTIAGKFVMAASMGGLFTVLAAMFFVLAKSPKGNPYILNRYSGLTKNGLIVICIIVAYVVIGLSVSMGLNAKAESNDSVHTMQSANENNDGSIVEKTSTEISLADIQQWYESQIPTVTSQFLECTQSLSDISNISVSENQFLFGDEPGWYYCYYELTYSCDVNGENCTGTTRAFMKYNDSNPAWFYCKVFRNYDYALVSEYYDEAYGQIITEYYKELVFLYK